MDNIQKMQSIGISISNLLSTIGKDSKGFRMVRFERVEMSLDGCHFGRPCRCPKCVTMSLCFVFLIVLNPQRLTNIKEKITMRTDNSFSNFLDLCFRLSSTYLLDKLPQIYTQRVKLTQQHDATNQRCT